ncbi:MAG: GTP 3',8-cyclase MoaA [Venatoribacter sp.]
MSKVLIDGLGRKIDYVRISITDRCDFRCVYCMAEDMQFLPRAQVLTLEEIYRTAQVLVANGVSKIRLTGGEPLTRKNMVSLCEKIAALEGLKELVITTNGSQLAKYAKPLFEAGVKRLNISLDTLNPERFKAITRTGDLHQVLLGIEAAQQAGFKRTKLNTVVIRGQNDQEILPLTRFAVANQLDLTFIEEMPLGQVGRNRKEGLFLSDEVREILAQEFELIDSTEKSGGPARYARLKDHSHTRIGFISPHSHNFCSSCNRVRLTAEGQLLLCLGNEHNLDMRALLRRYPLTNQPLEDALHKAMQYKPERHHFSGEGEVQILRFMNATGG